MSSRARARVRVLEAIKLESFFTLLLAMPTIVYMYPMSHVSCDFVWLVWLYPYIQLPVGTIRFGIEKLKRIWPYGRWMVLNHLALDVEEGRRLRRWGNYGLKN